jgi:hypothetical protein
MKPKSMCLIQHDGSQIHPLAGRLQLFTRIGQLVMQLEDDAILQLVQTAGQRIWY